jgi:poly(3-hydroxybutyrate) depolymerase
MAAYCELVSLAAFTHTRPDFGIDVIETRNGPQIIDESVVYETPFSNLVKFAKRGVGGEPKVLLIAPMSGHFATLLRKTALTLLGDHEVYITDWKNARNVPLADGVFDLDAFIQHLVDFMRFLGPNCHVVAVCQPTVAALAACAVLARENDPAQPASLTLMAGPIDPRINPTKVNELANEKPIEWFRKKLISVVPNGHGGGGRHVYPGFLQIAAFMSMNVERHSKSFVDLFNHRVAGDGAKADVIKAFYEEYFSIMDLAADFYLETIEQVFQKAALPQGKLMFRGEAIDLRAIRKTFLLTVEGERDDICAVGQTLAAQDLCSGLKPYMKSHHMQPGVGHYGVFSGKRWDTQIYPVVRNHIQASA